MFERYYRELLNFLALKVRDRDAAADLTQESFARVYAAQRSGTAVRNPRALLYSVARNLLADGYRRISSRQPGALEETQDRPAEPDECQGPEALEPETALSSRQRFEAIADTVDRLAPRCRQAFLLVKFEGLTHAQTAQRMGITVKTVEMQVQIALEACRDRLASFDGDAPGPRGPKGRAKKDSKERQEQQPCASKPD